MPVAAPIDKAPRSTLRGPRAEQRQVSRRRLIDAAREFCVEGRFLGCAVAEIADKAGLSRAAFYLHFKGKEDLLEAVLADQLDWYLDQHAAMSEARASTVEGIVGWLRQFVEGFRNAGDLLNQFFMASPVEEIVRQQQAARLTAIEALGRGVPALRLFGPDGAIDPDRRRRVLLYVYQLEQACATLGYSDDEADAAAMLQLLAQGFQDLTAD